MVEKAARAAHERFRAWGAPTGEDLPSWGDLPRPSQLIVIDKQRAAIEALGLTVQP
jgi:hypothetical protein